MVAAIAMGALAIGLLGGALQASHADRSALQARWEQAVEQLERATAQLRARDEEAVALSAALTQQGDSLASLDAEVSRLGQALGRAVHNAGRLERELGECRLPPAAAPPTEQDAADARLAALQSLGLDRESPPARPPVATISRRQPPPSATLRRATAP